MGSRLTEIVVDCHDPAAQAAFWAAALGYRVVRNDEGQVEIAPREREPPDLAERVRRAPGTGAGVRDRTRGRDGQEPVGCVNAFMQLVDTHGGARRAGRVDERGRADRC